MIQDIAPHIFDNQYKNLKPTEDSYCLSYSSGKVLVMIDGDTATLPTYGELDATTATFLFSVDDAPVFLVDDGLELDGYEYVDMRSTYHKDNAWIPLAIATGGHLRTWYQDTQFCGRCGKPMKHHDSLRAMKCECGNMQFPRIAPVVLAAIVKDDKIVATRYKGRPYKGLALNAGFVEIGESLEQALTREVEEEVGLKVGKLHYFGSQPWGHTGIVMAGFFVEIEGDDTITMDEDELAEAFWISRDELPVQENTMALTATMFEAFRKGEVEF